MIASDIMTRPPVAATPDMELADIIRLMLEHRVGALPVVDGATVVGIVAEADLLRRLGPGAAPRPASWLGLFTRDSARAEEFVRSHGTLARDIMTQPAVTVPEDTPLGEIAELLDQRGLGQVPVLRDGRLAGMVRRADLLGALAGRLAPPPPPSGADDQRLREAVAAVIEGSGWLHATADLTVEVEAGVVSLWGTVTTAAIHRALVVAVGEVAGAGAVRDHLVPSRAPDPLDLSNWPTPAPP